MRTVRVSQKGNDYTAVTGGEATRWEIVQRIVSSKRFGRSPLLANFLLFVAHRFLTGQAEQINEQQIGVHVFGRNERFNRADDNIVRTYARMLRARLEAYFHEEGSHEPWLISIPRGSYVPVFTERVAPELDDRQDETGAVPEIAAHPADLPAVSPALSSHRYAPGPRTFAAGALALLVAFATGLLLDLLLPARGLEAYTPAGRLSHRFWSRMFEPSRDTYLVPADGGLVMLQSFLPRHVNLTDYANGSYRNPEIIRQGLLPLAGKLPTAAPADRAVPDLLLLHKVEVLGARRYTSVVDLELTAHLSRLPEVRPQRLVIRYARDLRMDDLRSCNLVLIGSADSNPWVDLFQPQLNFQFISGAAYGGSAIIVNSHPLSGERPAYGSEDSSAAHRSYGVIAYLPNLGMAQAGSDGRDSGHVILIEGINMAGTQAAGSFLLSTEQMKPVLEQATDRNGIIHPFEVLLDTSNIAANSAGAHVLSERVGL